MKIPECTYEHTKRIVYGSEYNTDGEAWFLPRCPKCGRIVKADKECYVDDGTKSNATCSKCGRIRMPFEGYF